MADATYDAVIVGGGTTGLFSGIYLTKYGGLKVAIFEERHELGGGYGSHEAPAPGFIGDTHASTHNEFTFLPIQQDFSDFEEKGGRFVHYPVARGIITREDHKCFNLYHRSVDPTGERTAREVARFSGPRDADTFMKLLQLAEPGGSLYQALIEETFNLPPPPGQPTAWERWLKDYLARQPDGLIDARWLQLPMYYALLELWESKAIVYMQMRMAVAAAEAVEYPAPFTSLINLPWRRGTCYAVGGTHSIAHACYRIFVENGGRFFTHSPVSKILIENGKARGIRLADGTEVSAKMVITTVDPYQLCFELVGPEHLNSKLLTKVANLQRTLTTITWYTWAMHELPKYRAADYNPDINQCHWTILGSHEPEYLHQAAFHRRIGKEPPGDAFVVFGQHSQFDPSRVPTGKHVVSTEEDVLASYWLTEREWMKFKKAHAEKTLRVLQNYAPNMTWDNVIGYDPITPYDIARRERNMAPAGNFAVIDFVTGQLPPFRPIRELASHRTPIQNLYATGMGWGLHVTKGYTCYKAIAQDLGLRKPWEEKGRGY